MKFDLEKYYRRKKQNVYFYVLLYIFCINTEGTQKDINRI